jgi:MurNAc alpha-1-phosphate uridylyltransferase
MIHPRTGMVLAAGRGERLRPITDTVPKPLVRVDEQSLLDHAIDRLVTAGVERIVVNVHYLAGQIIDHLHGRHDVEILISEEPEALETGGAVVRALPLLGDQPFYVLNGDCLWLNGRTSALERLARAWSAETDAVLLLQRTATAIGYESECGDFMLDQLGRLRRRLSYEVAPYLFAGVQLLSPSLFKNVPEGKFSLNLIYDRAAEADRLTAIVHDSEWYHISTPDGLDLVKTQLAVRRTER